MKKKKSNFRGKVQKDTQRQKAANAGYGYLILPKDVHVFNAEPGGKVVLDFIPYEVTDKRHPDRDSEMDIATPGTLWYKRPFKIHRNIGAEKDAVVCPASFGKPCPICEYWAKRKNEGAEKEELDAIKTSLRNLYLVIPKGHKKLEEEIHIWDMSQFLFQNLLNTELEEDDDNACFPELEGGLSLQIRFDSKSFGSGKPFAEASRIDFKERTEDYDEEILERVPNLDEVLKVLSYKELEAKFFEIDDVDSEEDSEEEEDEAPTTKKVTKKSSTKRKPKPEPEDDEEEEDLEDDEEEEEEEPAIKRKPSRKPVKKSVKKPKPEEEEDDDEDEDEDEGMIECVACGGSGTNSKGRKCPICNGTGVVPDPDLEEDEEDEEEPTPKKGKTPSNKKVNNKCPYGHKFGKDCEKFDDCDECESWNDCIDAQD